MKVLIEEGTPTTLIVTNVANGTVVYAPKKMPVSQVVLLLNSSDVKYCYQCNTPTTWLAPDSRCGECTRYTPEEIQGVSSDEDFLESRMAHAATAFKSREMAEAANAMHLKDAEDTHAAIARAFKGGE